MNREPRSLSHSECSGSTKSESGAPEKLTERSDSGAEGDAEEKERRARGARGWSMQKRKRCRRVDER
jgi:hypothetical protein